MFYVCDFKKSKVCTFIFLLTLEGWELVTVEEIQQRYFRADSQHIGI
jgi:hypothetical protein